MTTYTHVQPKRTSEIREKLVKWLNDNLTDPYEQSTDKKRDTFVSGKDFTLSPIWPKIHVAVGDISRDKITAQKINYLEQLEHTFFIYYYNQKSHKFTFDNGARLSDEDQCRDYLENIQTKLKARLDDFGEYFHKTTFGTIPGPIFNTTISTWVSMLPLVCYTYKR